MYNNRRSLLKEKSTGDNPEGVEQKLSAGDRIQNNPEGVENINNRRILLTKKGTSATTLKGLNKINFTTRRS